MSSQNRKKRVNRQGLQILANSSRENILQSQKSVPAAASVNSSCIPPPPPGFPFLNCGGGYISYGYVVSCPFSGDVTASGLRTPGLPVRQSTPVSNAPTTSRHLTAGPQSSPFSMYRDPSTSPRPQSPKIQIYEDSGHYSSKEAKNFQIYQDSGSRSPSPRRRSAPGRVRIQDKENCVCPQSKRHSYSGRGSSRSYEACSRNKHTSSDVGGWWPKQI